MRRVIPFMVLDLALPLAPTIFATDAQGSGEVVGDHGGYGVVAASVGLPVARTILEHGRLPRRTVVSLDGDVSRIRNPEREFKRVVPFSSVPKELVLSADWRDVSWGRWKHSDHITLGECRSVVKLLSVLAPLSSSHAHLLLSLEDNMPVCGCTSKGRSSSYPLNSVLRRKTALCLACHWKLVLPWTDTHTMPADHLSRLV